MKLATRLLALSGLLFILIVEIDLSSIISPRITAIAALSCLFVMLVSCIVACIYAVKELIDFFK